MRPLRLLILTLLATAASSNRLWSDTFIFQADSSNFVVGSSIPVEHFGDTYQESDCRAPDGSFCPYYGANGNDFDFGFVPQFAAQDVMLVKFIPVGPNFYYSPDYGLVDIYDPSGDLIAAMEIAPGDESFYDMHFFAAVPGIPFVPPIYGLPPPSLSIVENGQVQDAINVQWTDGTTDTFEFQITPETSSLLLLGTVLLGVLIRRKIIRSA